MVITNARIGIFSAGIFVAILFIAFSSLQQVHAEETEKQPEIETESGGSTESGGGTSGSGDSGRKKGNVEYQWKVEEGEGVKSPYDSAGDDTLVPYDKVKTGNFENPAIHKDNAWKNRSSKPVEMENSEFGNVGNRKAKERKVRNPGDRKRNQSGVSRKGKPHKTHSGR